MVHKSQNVQIHFDYFVKATAILFYGGLCGYFLSRHAMWRDELQLWLVASKSETIQDLISNKNYEVRPYIWFLVCWILSRFTRNPEILKIFNFGVAITLASFVVFRCTGSLLLRISFLFGFLTLFGYCAISEEYLLGTLIFIIAISQIQRNRSELSVILLASILANINLLFAIVSIGIVIVPVISLFNEYRQGNHLNKSTVIGFFIFPIFFTVSLASMWPPNDFAFRSTSLQIDLGALKRMAAATANALFPFLNRGTFNGSYGFLIALSTTLLSFFAIVALILCAFKKSVAIGLSTTVGLTLTILWTGIGYANYWWHFGIILISYFGFTLLSLSEWRNSQIVQKVCYVLSCLILSSQTVALFWGPNLGVYPAQPYSMAKKTASFIENICDETCTLITNDEVTGASISAYLGGEKLYQANRRDFGTFAVWDSRVGNLVSWEDLLDISTKFTNPIFVTSAMGPPPNEILVLSDFSGAVWADENFLVSKPGTS